MNWLLRVIIYVAAVLVVAVVDTVMAKALEVETSGKADDRIGMVVIRMVLCWGLFLVYLEVNGAKIVWPPN